MSDEIRIGDIMSVEYQRVCILEIDEQFIFVVGLDKLFIRRYNALDFLNYVDAGEYVKIVTEESNVSMDLSAEELTKIQKQQHIFETVLSNTYPAWEDLYIRGKKNREIFEAAQLLQTSVIVFRRKFLKFLRSGRNLYSLVDQRHFKSAKNLKVQKKDTIQEQMDYALTVFKKTLSVTKAYESVVAEYYMSYQFVDGTWKKVQCPREECISYRRIHYYIANHLGGKTIKEYTKGQRDYLNNHRLLTGNMRTGLINIGQRFQLDECEIGVTLVAEDNPNKIIGKAVMYCAYDAVSQMIIGVHVGLQNNSFSGFCNLMMSLLEPHKNQTELVGVSCTDAEFPSCVLPREIHADHGSEYESKALQKAMQELGITVSLVPVAAGSFKGGVENVFMRLQHVLRLTLQKDGYIMSDENGPKNARKQACLTLKDMRAIVYKIVLDLNTRLLPGYSPSIEMLDAKIKLSPAEIWKFEMKRSGSPICVTNSNRQQILFALLSRDRKFKITRAGIEYVGHKLIYFVDEQWFTTMIREKNPECEIRYDDLSVKQIYVRYKKQIHVVSLSVKREELATFERLSWNEYDALFTELKQRQKEERYEDLGRRIETEDFIHHTAKIARPLQEAENDTKNIKENRLLETQKLRVEKTELRNRQLQAFHKDADTKAELEEIVETPVLETKTDDSTDVYGFLGDDDE